MKETISRKILKEAGVLLIAAVMVLSTVAVTANTNDQSPELMLAHTDYISHPQQTNAFDPDWIHFDDGVNYNGIGTAVGGTIEGAIRITPDELGDYDEWLLTSVRFFHDTYGGGITHSGNIKIYEEGTSTEPGALITSEPYTVTGKNWFEIPLSNPSPIDVSEDIWVSVEVTFNPGEYPLGVDNGPAVDGKGDWWGVEGEWSELIDYGLNYNWNIWAGVELDTDPPETPERPDGPTEGVTGVEYTFSTSTTDPEGKQVSYLWDWGDETPTEWTDFHDSGVTVYASHIWTEAGKYNITVKAKDVHDIESNWSDPLAINIVDTAILEIGNKTGGLFKVSSVIRNIGGVDATSVNWSITLTGGIILLGKETDGSIAKIPAEDEANISSGLIFGFGKTVITVTAECAEGSSDTNTRDAFVLLLYILVI